MEINQETLQALLTLISGGNKQSSSAAGTKAFGIGEKVLVRTYSAGVFFGTLKERDGQEAILENSRRIWSWEGAFTLSAVSRNGVSKARLSIVEPEKLVTQVIEVIPCSLKCSTQLEGMEVHDDN